MAWLPGYAYRKPLVITGGPDGAQTDFQIDLAVAHVTDHMKTSFDDVRFTQNNGTSLIDAWLESKVVGTSADVWGEFPTTPANTVEQTYYMYYGNAGAGSYWDGAATFPDLFDDFSGGSLDVGKWGSAGSPVQTGGEIICGGTAQERIVSTSTFQYKRFRSRAKLTWGGGTYATQLGFSSTYAGEGTNTLQMYQQTTGLTRSLSGDASTSESTDLAGSYNAAYHNYEILWKNGEVKYYIDGVLKDTDTTRVPTASLPVFFETYRSAAEVRSDWVFVSKYVSNPPTYAFGAEESAPTAGVRPPRVFYGPFNGPLGGPI